MIITHQFTKVVITEVVVLHNIIKPSMSEKTTNPHTYQTSSIQEIQSGQNEHTRTEKAHIAEKDKMAALTPTRVYKNATLIAKLIPTTSNMTRI